MLKHSGMVPRNMNVEQKRIRFPTSGTSAAVTMTTERTPDPDRADVVSVIAEHEELFRRLAASDLPIAEDAQRALRLLEQEQGDDSRESAL